MLNTRDDDVGRQYNVFQHQHQVTVAQRPHDAGQRSDSEQRSDMRQQHASQLQRSVMLRLFNGLLDALLVAACIASLDITANKSSCNESLIITSN